MKNNFFDPESLALEAEGENDGDFEPGNPLPDFVDPLANIELNTPLQNQEPINPPKLTLAEVTPANVPTTELLNEVKSAVAELVMPSLVPADSSPSQLAEHLFELVLSDLPFAQLCDEVLKKILSAVNAAHGSIIEVEQNKKELFFRACVGADILLASDIRIPIDQGLAGKVIQTRVLEVVNHSDSSGNPNLKTALSILANVEIKNAMAAPILIDNQIFAVIEAFNSNIHTKGFSSIESNLFAKGAQMAGKIFEIRFLLAKLVHDGSPR